jgi:hypothetical protein
MDYQNVLSINECGKAALIFAMLVPFGLIFFNVIHGLRLKREVDDDRRHFERLAKEQDVKTLAELRKHPIGK